MNIPIPRIRDHAPVILAVQAVLVDGLLTVVDERNRQTVYQFAEIPTDLAGQAFRLHKTDDSDVYHVNVAADVRETHCSCIGFQRYGNCKHVSVCRELIARSRQTADIEPADDPDTT